MKAKVKELNLQIHGKYMPEKPTKSGSYLVCINNAFTMNVNYSAKYEKFNACDALCTHPFPDEDITWWIDVTDLPKLLKRGK